MIQENKNKKKVLFHKVSTKVRTFLPFHHFNDSTPHAYQGVRRYHNPLKKLPVIGSGINRKEIMVKFY